MKTLKEIIAQSPVFLDIFESKEDVKNQFEVSFPDSVNILFAYYSYEDYSGDAFVLFEQDGLLYEVNGSHCSCYGLEGQWEPEEVCLEEMNNRFTKGSNYGEHIPPLKTFLGL